MFSIPALGVALAAVAAGPDTPAFTVATKRADDRVTWAVEKGATVFDVRSEFGISEATVERTGPSWPDAVTLRLHLTGLEMFAAEAGTAGISGKVSNPRDPRPFTLAVAGRKDVPQAGLEVRVVDRDGKPAAEVPLKNGSYIEVTLPKGFFDGNPKAFTMTWVDWYRR